MERTVPFFFFSNTKGNKYNSSRKALRQGPSWVKLPPIKSFTAYMVLSVFIRRDTLPLFNNVKRIFKQFDNKKYVWLDFFIIIIYLKYYIKLIYIFLFI